MRPHVVARDASVFALVVDVEQLPAAAPLEEERHPAPMNLSAFHSAGLWLAVMAIAAVRPEPAHHRTARSGVGQTPTSTMR